MTCVGVPLIFVWEKKVNTISTRQKPGNRRFGLDKVLKKKNENVPGNNPVKRVSDKMKYIRFAIKIIILH